MDSRAKKISTIIFLLAIFVFLAIFIGGWLYRVYMTQSRYSTHESASAVDCAYYSFNVESLSYENGRLYFELDNKGNDQFDTIVIESGGIAKEVSTEGMVAGMSQPIDVEIALADDVSIYPKGCKDHNSKGFQIN